MLRRQIREIAKQNATTQSHLIEVLTGVQTVKAQNIETVSRWKWQEFYSGYISRTFEKTITIVICFINFILSYNNTKYYANDIQKQDDCSDGSEAVNENFDVIKTNVIVILVGLAVFLLLGVCKFPIVGDIIGSFTGFCIF